MPTRLPVARERPPWLRYGSVVVLLALASVLTWAIPPVARYTPFMFYFAVVTIVAVFGGARPAALAVLGSLAVVHGVLWPAAGVESRHLANEAGFVLVSALIAFLADRAIRSTRKERALREWAEVTLRSVGDAVIVTDLEGRVLTMNAVAEQLTGWSEAEADQQPLAKVFEIVNEETRSVVEGPVDRVRRGGGVVGLASHTLLLSRDGREIPTAESGGPIWSEDGRLVGAVLVSRDVRERHEGERQRAALLASEQVARATAQAANRAKDDFLAVLS